MLSSDDPIRVFQQFATLDNISNGRAEIMAGRGSFIESFPLFGYDLGDYDTLFAEKLEMLIKLNEGEIFSMGRRPAHAARQRTRRLSASGAMVNCRIWLAVGGTPQSVGRAAMLGLPLALAIIGGEPARFAPFFKLYREAAEKFGRDPATLKTSINVHGFVGQTRARKPIDTFYPAQAEVMNRIGRERGWPPTSRQQFEAAAGPRGAQFVGDASELTDKILAHYEIFGFDRFVIQMAIGVMDHAKLLKAIEILGTRVAPEVKKAVGERRIAAA